MKLCRRVDDPIIGTMLGVAYVDRLETVLMIGGEDLPDVMGDEVRRRLEFAWLDVINAVVSARWGLTESSPRPARI